MDNREAQGVVALDTIQLPWRNGASLDLKRQQFIAVTEESIIAQPSIGDSELNSEEVCADLRLPNCIFLTASIASHRYRDFLGFLD